MNRDGSKKKNTYIKSYISYNLSFIIFFVRPLLLGAPFVNVGNLLSVSKAAPIRVGHTKKIIKEEWWLIYHIQ